MITPPPVDGSRLNSVLPRPPPPARASALLASPLPCRSEIAFSVPVLCAALQLSTTPPSCSGFRVQGLGFSCLSHVQPVASQGPSLLCKLHQPLLRGAGAGRGLRTRAGCGRWSALRPSRRSECPSPGGSPNRPKTGPARPERSARGWHRRLQPGG